MMEDAARAEERHRSSVEEIRRMNEQYLADSDARHRKDMDVMKEQFKAAAAEIASMNSREFREQSTAGIADMLAPIKEKFAELDRTMKTSHTESVKYNSELSASIRLVMEQSRHVGEEARNLADALSGRSKVQGDFGEMLLKDILKNAGLQEGLHFISQGVITDSGGHEVRSEEGVVMIPDTLVFYPDDTMVVVDSKVSLTAFNSYMAASSAADRDRYAREHVESVRKHVDELKSKDYASYIPEGKRKVDYNIMFIPIEGAFRLMLDEAPLLWQTAKNNNVLIVSQMTLVIVLNMIQMSWKQSEQEKNIEEVYRTASELMGQLQGWMSSFVDIGTSLDRAVKSYTESKKKLADSRQSVIGKIGKLEFIDANEPIVLADSMVAVAIAIAYIEDHNSVNNMVRQIVNTIVSIVNPDYESDDINLSIGLSRSATAEIALDFIARLLCEALEESDEEEASSQDDGENDDAATDE